MKLLPPILFVAFASATIVKRASVNDVAVVGYAALAGTTGGSGGASTTVTTLAALTSAVASETKKIVIISGTITGATVVNVGSNTSLIGAKGSSLVGVGIRVVNRANIIIRNVKISKVLAETGDAIAIQGSSAIWIDHVDLSSDLDHDKDYYDGLLDLTRGITGVSVTNSKLYNHNKASVAGDSDSNGDEDSQITVTYTLNYWTNLSSRTPVFRFGHGHLFNNLFINNADGINTRDEAQLLVENNVWSGGSNPLYSTNNGYAVQRGNEFGTAVTNLPPTGTFSVAPYTYTLLPASVVRPTVTAIAGQSLTF
ncbi:polysaccharide lyase family 1 protein [Flagelloscypha sp. PMI_526]|nr:polysaccharide lyase family 1 protein [Flagelloscypha sp. PMI_526]